MPRFYLDCFLFPGRVSEYRAGLRMAGANPARYQRTLAMLLEHATIADQGGFEGLCFSEQHNNDMIISGGENVYSREVELLLGAGATSAAMARSPGALVLGARALD